MSRFWLLRTLLLTLLAGGAAHAAPDPQALSKKLDALYRSDASQGRMEMQVVTPDYQRTLTLDIWSQGMDRTLVVIRAPRKEKGVASLKLGNEMHNYLPKVKRTIRIPPSMMMGSWMGSDFTNDDLMREASWETDYTAETVAEPPAGQACLDYRPRPTAPVTWSRVRVCFDTATELPVVQQWWDEKDRLAREMTFDEVKVLGGRTLPTRLTLVPKLKAGHKTVVRYLDMTFGVTHPANTFSLSRLRRGR